MHRAVFAEALGSMMLAAAVIGSGIMAQQLTGDGAVALLANALATIAALAVLIAAFAPVSGAHFNPAVSLTAYLRGDLSLSVTASYMLAQLIGCCLGAVLAHAMFELPLIQAATHDRAGYGQWLSEMVAAAGLVFVASGCSSAKEAAWRVPAWIGAAYWFTASTSFANPAITLSRSLSDTFSGIVPSDVLAFVVAQFVGAIAGMFLARSLRTPAKGSAKVSAEAPSVQ